MRRLSPILLAATWCVTGCATIDRAAYDTSLALAPPHPVTGQPVLNAVPEEQEIRQAQQAWAQLAAAAQREGIPVDPPADRSRRIKVVFDRLVAVAHRQHLPWEVHLVGVSDVNAFTPGGGMVVVLAGLFGGLIPPDDDDALAAVLAHEIAHVTMLHVPTSQTWMGFGTLVAGETRNDYYRAAYSTDHEAEADRISVLYLALAGFDPMAASRVWEHAHQRYGSSAAQQGFLHDHPLNAERMAATQQAASLVQQYRVPGHVNPEWEALLASNTLYQRVEEPDYAPGVGTARAAAAALGTWATHEQARQEMKARKRSAKALQSVRIVRTWEQPAADGYQGIFFDVQNGSTATVSQLAVDIHYLSGQQLIGTDSSCRLSVNIPPGQTARLGCYKRHVAGATAVTPQIVDLRWQKNGSPIEAGQPPAVSAAPSAARQMVGGWVTGNAGHYLALDLHADGTLLVEARGPFGETFGTASGRWTTRANRFEGQIETSTIPALPRGHRWSDEIVSVSDRDLVLRNQAGAIEAYVRR